MSLSRLSECMGVGSDIITSGEHKLSSGVHNEQSLHTGDFRDFRYYKDLATSSIETCSPHLVLQRGWAHNDANISIGPSISTNVVSPPS